MRIDSRSHYEPLDFKKVPFLNKVGDKVFNGSFDVTDVHQRIVGVKTGEEDVRMRDYLVYRPLPKVITALFEKPNVHEHSYDMQVHYKKIWKAVKEGVQTRDEYFNPFYMLWIAVFVFEILDVDKAGNIKSETTIVGRPRYSTVDRYIFDIMWKAYKQRKYVALMSGRGIGKSFFTIAVTMWYYIFNDGQEILISGTSEDITSEAWNKVKKVLKFMEKTHPGLKQKRRVNSLKKIEAAEEYYDDYGELSERGSLNFIEKIVYGDDSNSTRGRRPHFQHIEEFASFPAHPAKGSLKNVLGQSKGSWIIEGSHKKAFVALTGTGGSVNNADAEAVFMNPRAYNILPILEWSPGGREKVETGLFIPSHLKYGGTWERTGTPDIHKALGLMLENRKNIASDAVALMQELQEFPIVLEEVFLRKGTNNFNQDKIADQIIALQSVKEKPWQEGRLDWIINKGVAVGVKFTEVRNGPVVIIEHPKRDSEGELLKNLYVGGVDGIDQGKNDSLVEGSKLAVAIKKRINGGIFSDTSNLYVAFYNERSDNVRDDYKATLMLSMYYNAKMNIEYTKIGVVAYFREKGKFNMLMKRPSIAIGANVSGLKASKLIGSPATTVVIDHQDEKLTEYIEDYCEQIMYLPALHELKDYSREDRRIYDLVIAMGLAELADEDLMQKPATSSSAGSAEDFNVGMYTDPTTGIRRWGAIPTRASREISSISLHEEEEEHSPVNWV